MTDQAQHRNALVIATSYGVEQAEIVEPRRFLEESGHTVTVATPENRTIRTLVGDKDPGDDVTSDARLADVHQQGFDLLVIPGGTLNADSLRLDADALRLVQEFAEAGAPIAAICHGPWLLVEAGIASGRSLTSYPSLRTDVTNAGGSWTDESVVVDDSVGSTLITSRTPDDLAAFTGAIGDALR